MKTFDLTYPFDRDIPVFPGDSYPQWRQVATIASEGYNSVQLRTGMHVGTHMDAPLHMIEDGQPLSAYPPDFFIGPGLLINAEGASLVGEEYLHSVDLDGVAMVLVYTGWGVHFRHPRYFEEYPELSTGFARRLVNAGIRIVGLDFPSPDRAPYEVHRILLGNGVLIVENLMDLGVLLPYPTFEVIALPARYEADGAPVRVVARVMEP